MNTFDALQTLVADINPQLLTLAALLLTLGLLTGAPMFESLLSYIWNTSHEPPSERSSRKSSGPRTRSQQLAAQGINGESGSAVHPDEVYYPGLVNISGTYCFLDSTLQALASLSYLQPEVDSIHERAEDLDIPTPVIDALRSTLNDLNTPRRSRTSLRPIAVIDALSQPDPKSTRSRTRLFSSREHQDAQELFQLISSCIQEELIEVQSESRRDPGLAIVDHSDDAAMKDGTKNVFEGLTANRRSCMECGYTEAVMHFSFDNVTLPVPTRAMSCKLEDCLNAYTLIEVLNDCICRKCSMLATLGRLTGEIEELTAELAKNEGSKKRKRRLQHAQDMKAKVQKALDDNSIEQDIPDLQLEKVTSSRSTKQAMIARPPPILVLHLNRSSYFGYGQAAKNSCQVIFPEILDLTPYTTSGALSTAPSSPISSHNPPPPFVSDLPTASSLPATAANRASASPILYRLAAVVCHYGSHSFGHYITYRRKPHGHRTSVPAHLGHPRITHPLTCLCSACVMVGRVRDHEPSPDQAQPTPADRGWLRISDDSVQEVGLGAVLREASGTFMLYYERVLVDPNAVEPSHSRRRSTSISKKVPPPLHLDATGPAQPYIHAVNASASSSTMDVPGASSPRSSEETITPENVRLSETGSPQPAEPTTPRAEPLSMPPADVNSLDFPRQFSLSRGSSTSSGRIVRNVSAGASGRSRTNSANSQSSHAPPSKNTSIPQTSRPAPLVIETDPSPLPPGSARTRTKFTPPGTPAVSTGSLLPATATKSKRKHRSKKSSNGSHTPLETKA